MNLFHLISTTTATLLLCGTVLASGPTKNPSSTPSGDEETAKKETLAPPADPEPIRMPVLAIEPPLNTEELAIIPNPTQAMFRFSYYMPGIEIIHVRLEDEMGELIHQMDIGGHEEMYNLPFKFWEYPDGVYYLEVQTDRKAYKRRIVKANYEQ